MTFDTSIELLEDSAFHGFDVEEAYENEVAENKRLCEIIDILTMTNSDAEIIKLCNKIKSLEGRLAQSMATEAEAIKQTKHNTKLLASIRKKLGVDNNTEILQKLKYANPTS